MGRRRPGRGEILITRDASLKTTRSPGVSDPGAFVCVSAAGGARSFRGIRGRVARAVVVQLQHADLAQVDVLPQHAGIAGIRPFDLEVPDAPLVGGVELHVDALPVAQHAAELVIGPVVVARIVESEKLDAVAGLVHDVDVAQIVRKRCAHRSQSHHGANNQASHLAVVLLRAVVSGSRRMEIRTCRPGGIAPKWEWARRLLFLRHSLQIGGSHATVGSRAALGV